MTTNQSKIFKYIVVLFATFTTAFGGQPLKYSINITTTTTDKETVEIKNYDFKVDPYKTPYNDGNMHHWIQELSESDMLLFRKNLGFNFVTQTSFEAPKQQITGYTPNPRHLGPTQRLVHKPTKVRTVNYTTGVTTVANYVPITTGFAWRIISNGEGYDYASNVYDPYPSIFRMPDQDKDGMQMLMDRPINDDTKDEFKWWSMDSKGRRDVLKENGKVESADVNIDRRSFLGPYFISVTGFPLNPMGATGVVGRGELWRWAVNPASDILLYKYIIVTDPGTGKETKKLHGALITRRLDNIFAFPGGFVDCWDNGDRWITIVHELLEEVFSCKTEEIKNDQKKRFEAMRKSFNDLVKKFLAENGENVPGYNLPRIHVVFEGYSDDRRNTDNAWVETTLFAVNVDGTDFDEYLKYPIEDWQPLPDHELQAVDPDKHATIPDKWKFWQPGDSAKTVTWKNLEALLTEIEADKTVCIDEDQKTIMFAGHANLVAEFLSQHSNGQYPAPYDIRNFNQKVLQVVKAEAKFMKDVTGAPVDPKMWFPDPNIFNPVA